MKRGRVFWDYAAAGPYVAIDASDKDAIFLSPHKFLGGPGTPGVLVVRKELLTGAVPVRGGEPYPSCPRKGIATSRTRAPGRGGHASHRGDRAGRVGVRAKGKGGGRAH